MPRTFSVEAAKTDRSTCNSCNKKIALKGLRIGTHNTSKQGIDLYTKWFHPACFKNKIKKGPTSKKDIAGFDKLKPNQQKLIKKHVIDVFAAIKSEDLFSSSDSSSDGDALNETTKKKEETKKGKKSKPRPWTQHEQDCLLKMDEEGKSVKVMAEELQRTESATKQKLRLLLIKKTLTCSVCSAQFETEKSLKLHQSRKQDIAHKQLREKKNKKKDDNTNNKEKKCKLKKIKNTNRNRNTNNNQNITNVNIRIQSKRKRQREEEMDDDDFDEPNYKKMKVNKWDWNEKEVENWIYSLGDDYKIYAGQFKRSGITGEYLNDLNDNELEEIVKNKIHRKIILKAWKQL